MLLCLDSSRALVGPGSFPHSSVGGPWVPLLGVRPVKNSRGTVRQDTRPRPCTSRTGATSTQFVMAPGWRTTAKRQKRTAGGEIGSRQTARAEHGPVTLATQDSLSTRTTQQRRRGRAFALSGLHERTVTGAKCDLPLNTQKNGSPVTSHHSSHPARRRPINQTRAICRQQPFCLSHS